MGEHRIVSARITAPACNFVSGIRLVGQGWIEGKSLKYDVGMPEKEQGHEVSASPSAPAAA